MPPPKKIFDILESKWRIFVDSLVLNCAFLYDENSKKYTRNAWSAMEIDLHAIKSVVYCLLLLTFTQTSQGIRVKGRTGPQGPKTKAESREQKWTSWGGEGRS